jgi:hypothetical protein
LPASAGASLLPFEPHPQPVEIDLGSREDEAQSVELVTVVIHQPPEENYKSFLANFDFPCSVYQTCIRSKGKSTFARIDLS